MRSKRAYDFHTNYKNLSTFENLPKLSDQHQRLQNCNFNFLLLFLRVDVDEDETVWKFFLKQCLTTQIKADVAVVVAAAVFVVVVVAAVFVVIVVAAAVIDVDSKQRNKT